MFNNKSPRLEEGKSFSVHSNTSYIEPRWRLGDDDDVGVVTQEVSTLELIRHVGREKDLQGVTHVVNSTKIAACHPPNVAVSHLSVDRRHLQRHATLPQLRQQRQMKDEKSQPCEREHQRKV